MAPAVGRRAVRAVFGRSEELAIAALAGVAGVAGSYGVAGFTPAFVVAPVESTMATTMPGVVVTFAIERLGSLGQQLNLIAAVATATALLAAVAFASLALGRAVGSRVAPVVTTTAGCWILATLLTGTPLVAAGAALPVGGTVALGGLVATDDDDVSVSQDGQPTDGDDGTAADGTDTAVRIDGARRRVLGTALSVAGFSGLGYVLGERRTPSVGGSVGGSDADELLSTAADRSLSVEGIEPLVSQSFYRVDVNAVDPVVDASEWSLSVTGAVEQDLELTRSDLQAMTTEHRFVTLRCVGENLNGRKMDTALWTGTPVAPLLDRAGPHSDCECVMLRAADGYYEEFPLAALRPGMLAYGMNGEVLPRAHGHPVRALVPGHWGEVNVKWLTEIELLERPATGYWEKRGWHGTGPVTTVAKLHHLDRGEGRLTVAGHAYAGTRGIRTVEVSTDAGSTLESARLSEPLPGVDGGQAADAWRQWAFDYDYPGPHEVVVRAVDGTGTVQPKERTGAFPDGPSGWVSRPVE